MQINWKKGLFSSTYQLFENGSKAGELSDNFLSTKSSAYLHDTRLQFVSKGVFSNTVFIFDQETSEQIGMIDFSFWGNKATIIIGDQTVQFKSTNFWGSKWSIYKDGQELVNFKNGTTKGEIQVISANTILVLAGLYLTNHYAQSAAAIVVIVAAITAASN